MRLTGIKSPGIWTIRKFKDKAAEKQQLTQGTTKKLSLSGTKNMIVLGVSLSAWFQSIGPKWATFCHHSHLQTYFAVAFIQTALPYLVFWLMHSTHSMMWPLGCLPSEGNSESGHNDWYTLKVCLISNSSKGWYPFDLLILNDRFPENVKGML